jgi:hypothetical protein
MKATDVSELHLAVTLNAVQNQGLKQFMIGQRVQTHICLDQ